jgi:hypothetical protein
LKATRLRTALDERFKEVAMAGELRIMTLGEV